MPQEDKWVAYNAAETEIIVEGDSFDDVYNKVTEMGIEDAVLSPVPEEGRSYIL